MERFAQHGTVYFVPDNTRSELAAIDLIFEREPLGLLFYRSTTIQGAVIVETIERLPQLCAEYMEQMKQVEEARAQIRAHCAQNPEEWSEILEGRRRTVRFWLWGRDVHVTLFVYSYEHWIMCSCYPYRLRVPLPEDRFSRAPFILAAHSRMFAHEYMNVIPVWEEVKAQIDEVLACEGERKDVPRQCPIG